MKKRMARLSALFFAATMTAGMTVPAFAANLTVPTSADHTYKIYQIFQGNPTSDGKLGNIVWGLNGIDEKGNDTNGGETVAESVLAKLEEVMNGSDLDILNVVNSYADTAADETPYATAASGETVKDVANGYYIVVDEAASGTLSTRLVKVVTDDLTMTAKTTDTPDFDKEVLDEKEDAEDGSTDGWGETADHEINEVFKFRLTASLPTAEEDKDGNIDNYKHYQLVFKDTMNEAVTYDGNPVVTVKSGTAIRELTASEYSLVSNVNEDGTTSLTVTIQDLKTVLPEGVTSLIGVEVEVVYNAHLNEKALVQNTMASGEANVNGAHLEYTRNPDWDGVGTPDDNEKTPEDYVFVFTYNLENQKIDEEGNALSGAEFELYREITDENGNIVKEKINLTYDETRQAYRPAKDGETVTVMKSSDNANATFNIIGLDDGNYYLRETKAPEEYQKLTEDIAIAIEAAHKEETDTTAKVTDITKKINNVELAAGTNTIENKKPSNLPETGGMGTVLFYTLGGALVIGAGSTIAVRKRMEKK